MWVGLRNPQSSTESIGHSRSEMNYGHKDHEHNQRDSVKLETAPGAPDHDEKGILVILRGDMQAFIDERIDERADALSSTKRHQYCRQNGA